MRSRICWQACPWLYARVLSTRYTNPLVTVCMLIGVPSDRPGRAGPVPAHRDQRRGRREGRDRRQARRRCARESRRVHPGHEAGARGGFGPSARPDPRQERPPAARVGQERPHHQVRFEYWLLCTGLPLIFNVLYLCSSLEIVKIKRNRDRVEEVDSNVTSSWILRVEVLNSRIFHLRYVRLSTTATKCFCTLKKSSE